MSILTKEEFCRFRFLSKLSAISDLSKIRANLELGFIYLLFLELNSNPAKLACCKRVPSAWTLIASKTSDIFNYFKII